MKRRGSLELLRFFLFVFVSQNKYAVKYGNNSVVRLALLW